MFTTLRTLAKQFSSVQKPALLFTPGPLGISKTVKESMNYDYGSREPRFIKKIHNIRQQLLDISNVSKNEYTSILVQGSGTFGVEATLGTSIPKNNHKLLIVSNGAYGERMHKISTIYGINHDVLRFPESEIIDPQQLKEHLQKDQSITHVSLIHSETTTGLINPIQQLGEVIKAQNPNIQFIVDAMSSFGAYPIYPKEWGIDYLVSSSNKCLQGSPGFSFIIANNKFFQKTQGNSRSLSLDLYDQWKGLESNGQFRFTPPTHSIVAFEAAIQEFIEQGGVKGRGQRYSNNQRVLQTNMDKLGFKRYIKNEYQGHILTTFLLPNHQNFKFDELYDYLMSKNLIIYPGKVANVDSFRIGSIGELYEHDILNVVKEIENYLNAKGIPIPVPY